MSSTLSPESRSTLSETSRLVAMSNSVDQYLGVGSLNVSVIQDTDEVDQY